MTDIRRHEREQGVRAGLEREGGIKLWRVGLSVGAEHQRRAELFVLGVKLKDFFLVVDPTPVCWNLPRTVK